MNFCFVLTFVFPLGKRTCVAGKDKSPSSVTRPIWTWQEKCICLLQNPLRLQERKMHYFRVKTDASGVRERAKGRSLFACWSVYQTKSAKTGQRPSKAVSTMWSPILRFSPSLTGKWMMNKVLTTGLNILMSQWTGHMLGTWNRGGTS